MRIRQRASKAMASLWVLCSNQNFLSCCTELLRSISAVTVGFQALCIIVTAGIRIPAFGVAKIKIGQCSSCTPASMWGTRDGGTRNFSRRGCGLVAAYPMSFLNIRYIDFVLHLFFRKTMTGTLFPLDLHKNKNVLIKKKRCIESATQKTSVSE